VTVHVDDLGIYNDVNNEVLPGLQEYFSITASSQPTYLGMEIKRQPEEHEITLTQTSYARSITEEFHELARPSARAPISDLAQVSTGQAKPDEIKRYQRIIGKLMYLACNTRPDLLFAVIHASRFSLNPSESAWDVVRDILGYLQRTTDFGITLKGRPGDLHLEQYSDALFATGVDGRSISGRITLLNRAPITWQSRQQTSVATSTAHSEYIAAYEAALQVLPLQDLLEEITSPLAYTVKIPTLVVDNTAAFTTAQSGILTRQNRHFLVKYYYLHEQLSHGALDMHWVSTEEQLADVLTKAVRPELLERFNKAIRLGI
jgi:hypothetical protein